MNIPLFSTVNPVKLFEPFILLGISLNSTINTKQNQKCKILVVKSNRESSTTTTTAVARSVSVVIKRNNNRDGETTARKVGRDKGKVVFLCALGFWIQGSRCLPWLALNLHMAHCLNLKPSTLQLVQYTACLPMVAKPFYGLLSDVFYIGGARRVPYISIGVVLQGLAWGSLAIFSGAREVLPSLIAFVLLGNLGASIADIAIDALVVEYGLKYQMSGLQSYALMASAVGGILGNLFGGYCLVKTPPRILFLAFTALLSLQLIVSLSTKEESVELSHIREVNPETSSVLGTVKKQCLDDMGIFESDKISHPLIWIIASIAMVPLLTGSVFCYQTQVLNLDSWVIGMSKVIGQLMLLCLTMVYDRYLKTLPLRPLIRFIQLLYAFSILFDFILVKQINLSLGISNKTFVLCFSSVAEMLSQFKILPFSVLLANMCPGGCEGSIAYFLASTLCLSSVVSGFAGLGMANVIGITSTNYTNLPVGILIQFFEKEVKRGMSKKSRRNRRVGRVVGQYIFAYRRERET